MAPPATGRRRVILAVLMLAAGVACAFKRPDITPVRMIEPQLEEPAKRDGGAPTVTTLRLLDTQARAHIGRRLLRQQPDGELVEDPIWRWSSAPDRYLDTALRLELTSRADVRLVDNANASALAVTLLTWNLDTSGEPRLVGAIEIQIAGADRVVRTQVVKESEPVSLELPGNVAAAAGRLLHRLASEGVTRVTR
jgi:hypothetical protein